MTTLRIDVWSESRLAPELHDILQVIGPALHESRWTIAEVCTGSLSSLTFEATGEGGLELEALAQGKASVDGQTLLQMAARTHQTIWGEFRGTKSSDVKPWIVIRAIDGGFFEVTSEDRMVIQAIGLHFADRCESVER